MNLNEAIKILEKQEKDIITERDLYYKALTEKDWNGAWKYLASMLRKGSESLRMCNEIMPKLKESVERKKKIKLENQENIVKEKKEEKSIKKMVVIPKKKNNI